MKYFQDKRNGKNKTSEDELNDLKKQLAHVTQQVRNASCLFYGSLIRKQLFFQWLQNIEKDRQIASLQRQLDCKTLVTSPSRLRENNNRLDLIDSRFEPAKKNGATQTERVSLNFPAKNILIFFLSIFTAKCFLIFTLKHLQNFLWISRQKYYDFFFFFFSKILH